MKCNNERVTYIKYHHVYAPMRNITWYTEQGGGE